MRTYAMTTGVIFALLTVVHLWRVIQERHSLGRDPWFLIITCVAAMLSIWAFSVARRVPRG